MLTCTVACPECAIPIALPPLGRRPDQGEDEITFDASALRSHLGSHQTRAEPEPTP